MQESPLCLTVNKFEDPGVSVEHLRFTGVVKDDKGMPISGAVVLVLVCFSEGLVEMIGCGCTGVEGRYSFSLPKPITHLGIESYKVMAGKANAVLVGSGLQENQGKGFAGVSLPQDMSANFYKGLGEQKQEQEQEQEQDQEQKLEQKQEGSILESDTNILCDAAGKKAKASSHIENKKIIKTAPKKSCSKKSSPITLYQNYQSKYWSVYKIH